MLFVQEISLSLFKSINYFVCIKQISSSKIYVTSLGPVKVECPYYGSQCLPSTVWLPTFFNISYFVLNRKRKLMRFCQISNVITIFFFGGGGGVN